jgi:hypothetical protein
MTLMFTRRQLLEAGFTTAVADFTGGGGGCGDATAILAAGSTISRTLAARAADVVNVKDFGAVGLYNGTTHTEDDTWAIQAAVAAALTAGRKVVFPPGTYRVTASITGADGISVEGASGAFPYLVNGPMLPSTLVADSGFAAGTAIFDFRNKKGTAIRHLGLQLGTTAAYGVELGDRANGTLYPNHHIEGNYIQGGAAGIRARNASLLHIRSNNISGQNSSGARGTGIWLVAYCGDSDIEGNFINAFGWGLTSGTNEDGTGIFVGPGSSNINIRGGKIEWNAKGIFVQNAQGVNVDGVNFDYNSWSHVSLNDDGADPTTATRSVNVIGNRFLAGGFVAGKGQAHVVVNAGNGSTVRTNVTGNTFRKGGDSAYDGNASGSVGPTGACIQVNSCGTGSAIVNVTGNDMQDGAAVNSIAAYGAAIFIHSHGNSRNLTNYIDGGAVDVSSTAVSNDRLDTGQTLTVGADAPVQRWATTLTANRTVKLSTTGAANGDTFRVVRSAGDSGGTWNLSVEGLKDLSANTWCEVAYDGTAWRLTGYGTL